MKGLSFSQYLHGQLGKSMGLNLLERALQNIFFRLKFGFIDEKYINTSKLKDKYHQLQPLCTTEKWEPQFALLGASS